MNVRPFLRNLLPMSITTSQLQMLTELSTAMDLPVGTVGRVLITGVFADPVLRARVPGETSSQMGRRFVTATDRCSFHVLVDDRTKSMVQAVMDSTQARIGKVDRTARVGEVARAALIVATRDLQSFQDVLRCAAKARVEAKDRGQQVLKKRVARMNDDEVQA